MGWWSVEGEGVIERTEEGASTAIRIRGMHNEGRDQVAASQSKYLPAQYNSYHGVLLFACNVVAEQDFTESRQGVAQAGCRGEL
eukprot:1757386-Rhodomonas_salina.2